MENQHTILVCSSCAGVWQDGKRVGTSGGEKLLKEIEAKHQNWELSKEFTVKSVECMSACSHSCAVAFTAPGKMTYLFGDLDRNCEALAETSNAVLECASLYYEKPDGKMAYTERPQALKKGVLARIPNV
jgi:predicted metal-binding protein